MKISVIGLGLIGGSIAKGLKQNHEVFVFDPDQNTLNEAKKENFKILSNIDEAVSLSELIIVAAPTRNSEEILKDLANKKYKNIVTDICSVKAPL